MARGLWWGLLAAAGCVSDAPSMMMDGGTESGTADGGADGPSEAASDAGVPCPSPDGKSPYLDDAIAISAGDDFACAIRVNGSVACWGNNEPFHQLAMDPMVTRRSAKPIPIGGLPHIVQISTGQGHAAARDAMGSVWSWGSNVWGEAGTNQTQISFLDSPRQAVGSSGTGTLDAVIDVSAGEDHKCAVRTGGDVYCWGRNTDKQLTDATMEMKRYIPIKASLGPEKALSVRAGSHITCAMLDKGGGKSDVACWGRAGFPTWIDTWIPIVVGNLPSFIAQIATATGPDFAVVLGSGMTGVVGGFGSNDYGQLGVSAMQPAQYPAVNIQVPMGSRRVSAKGSQTCVIVPDGTIQCLGRNDSGQLGIGTTDMNRHDVAAPVVALTDVFDVSVGGGYGGGFACAISGKRPECGGAAYCWGSNRVGQLGNGADVSTIDNNRLEPKPVRVVSP